MALIQIRNVPEEARRTLRARAAGRGKSLNAYLLELIAREVARPTVAEVLERAARRTEHLSGSSVDVIAAQREEREDHEIVSALRRLTQRRRLSAAAAEDALGDVDDLPLRRWPSAAASRRRACALRDSLTSYDTAVVILPEGLGCPLLTRDARIARSTGHAATVVVC
jgi:predicted nucleic acid-binding protein